MELIERREREIVGLLSQSQRLEQRSFEWLLKESMFRNVYPFRQLTRINNNVCIICRAGNEEVASGEAGAIRNIVIGDDFGVMMAVSVGGDKLKHFMNCLCVSSNEITLKTGSPLVVYFWQKFMKFPPVC